LAKIALDLGEKEDFLFDLTDQMDTEDGLIWVYSTDDDSVIALSNEGVECLHDLIAEHRRNQI